jgi:hypothetical protein
MENEEMFNRKYLTQDQKNEIIESWFDKYDIVKIVIQRPDYVIYLKD